MLSSLSQIIDKHGQTYDVYSPETGAFGFDKEGEIRTITARIVPDKDMGAGSPVTAVMHCREGVEVGDIVNYNGMKMKASLMISPWRFILIQTT